jgi:hypothetical protein
MIATSKRVRTIRMKKPLTERGAASIAQYITSNPCQLGHMWGEYFEGSPPTRPGRYTFAKPRASAGARRSTAGRATRKRG